MSKTAVDDNQRSSYRSILKATSVFGGVKIYQIIIQVVKAKCIAILLGPTGIGIQGLFQSAIEMMRSLTSFGISQSAVKDVSNSNASNDLYQVKRTISILRRIVLVTGIFGTILTAALSPLLSYTAFGNYDYTGPFIILSITLFIDQISAGQLVLLQGLRRIRDLAKATALGSTMGLLTSVPLYYLFGVSGIVPTLILNSLTMLVLSWYFSRKQAIETIPITPKEVIKGGKTMLIMGLAMSFSAILSTACSYILRGYLRSYGGPEEVGFFTAGYTLMSSYTGLVFSAMATDYYPRLAEKCNDMSISKMIINQQGEIGMFILTPLVVLCSLFVPQLVTLLYSESFHAIDHYIVFAASGMLFKMASWSISYYFVAHSDSRIFILNEVTANLYTLILNFVGYRLYGLSGLGLSFTASYIIYLLQVFFIANKKYSFKFTNSFIATFIPQMCIVALITLIAVSDLSPIIRYSVGAVILIISIVYSLYQMNLRMELLNSFKKYGK